MNNRQRIVQEHFLNNEEAVIKRLKQVYNQSLKDINKKAQELQNQINALTAALEASEDAEEAKVLKSMIQSKVYQKDYQNALKKQIGSILDNMQVEEFKTVAEYLQRCYEDGFISVFYDLQGQGIPLCMPLDQEAMVTAVQLDSKISKGLYSRLGEDVALLKKKITAQVSRGIATGTSWQQVAQQLAGYTSIGYNNAVRIARTEGHRIQVQSAMDACYKAQGKGANVVKQWDSTLDGRTRHSHARVDGEIRELDEPFSNGLMFPGDPDGGAAEVVNCRCALLQRAKWALDEAELETLKERAAFFELDKEESFEDFKKKYLKAAEDVAKATPTATAQKETKKQEPKKAKQDLTKFTDEQSEALEWYVSGESQWINQHLRGRGDFGELSKNEEKLLDLLSNATDRVLSDDIKTLYRSVDAKAVFGDLSYIEWERLQGGLLYGMEKDLEKVKPLINRTKEKVITEKAFMSTSKQYDVVADWGDFTGAEMPIVLEFDVPKGTKGADLVRFDVEGDEQYEVLLAKNTQYKITDISAKDGQIYLKAKIRSKAKD